MRKSFTWLSSFLVLMLLSFQMALAVPQLATTNGLKPSDGGILNPTNPVFTLTFKADVQPGEGQIIGLYSDAASQPENKAIQLRAVDKSTVDGVITYTHPDGTVIFNGSSVTITFSDVDWVSGPTYWVTIGASAIKDATGNFNAAAAFGADTKWTFTVQDLTPPTWIRLDPKDDETKVSTTKVFSIKFKESVKFVGNVAYEQQLEDFAIYTSTYTGNVIEQEGGDLVSTVAPALLFYNGTTVVDPTAAANVAFDSIRITWDSALPANTDLYVRIKKDMLQDLAQPVGNKFTGINNNVLWNISTKDDTFNKPAIIAEHAPLRVNSKFYVDFDASEVLYIASTGKVVTDGQDLKAYIKVTDKNNEPVAIKEAKINTSTNRITVVLNANMTEALAPYTVATTAGDFKDSSGNLSKANSAKFNAGNWNAPVLVEAKTTNYSGTSFDLLLTTNEPATVHYIVVKKSPAVTPTNNEIFGFDTNNLLFKDSGAGKFTDVYYNVNSSTTGIHEAIPAALFVGEGNVNRYYGKQTAVDKFTIVEVMAVGTVNVPTANFEVLKRITGLPATHGAEYEVYFVMQDNAYGDFAPLAADKFWLNDRELLSGVEKVEGKTVDILMPEAWFDGDSIVVAPKVLGDVKLNKTKANPADVAGALQYLSKNGKIYINFNEAVRDFDGNPLTEAKLKDFLFVYEGSSAPANKNSDTGWTSNKAYSASLSADKKTITITPTFAWGSDSTVWVKIKNSKIEDEIGNEIVPYGDLYAQQFIVQDYTAPLVRYTFGDIFTPMDSMVNVPYEKYVDGAFAAAPITVTISDHVYVFPGTLIDGKAVSLNDGLVPFTSNKDDDQYIGKFFKIRMGNGDNVNANMGNPLELTDFSFNINYNYGDSTIITITPTKAYASEVWYLIQIDERVIDSNLLTIAQGASVNNDADRPKMFKLANALTGNATVTGWVRGSAATDDNQSMVFKSEDSRNPELFFFSKKQSNLLDSLAMLDGKTNIAIDDTIGVYIDEYVSLGFDHYFKFDALSGKYELDANAMRRYFKVYDENDVMLQFDVVDLDTTALLQDSLIFFIDPYYVDSNGVALSATEAKNFEFGTSYTVYFNSEDEDDSGIEDLSGKTKGIYWDDNKNMVLETWAVFSVIAKDPDYCVEAVVTPVPGSKDLNPNTIDYVTVAFNYAAVGTIPGLRITEGAAGASTIYTGQLTPGNSNIIRYPVKFNSDSTYTVTIGTATEGHITINSGIAVADSWPSEACIPNADSTWTYTMVDATAPELDTLLTHTYAWFTQPLDDEIGFDKTDDIVMVFDEEVQLVPNKRLTIYDSSRKTVVYVLAQQCVYGKKPDKKDDKRVIVVPSATFASALKYNTDYHIIVDKGFVTDFSPLANQFAGILTEDLVANGTEDGINDWSFQTGSDPAPTFAKFLPANGTSAVQNLTVEFSESVYSGGTSADRITVYEVTAGPVFTQVDQFRPTNATKITPNASNKIWTINANALETPLAYGKQYVVTIDASAFVDSEGQALVYPASTTGISFVPASTNPVDEQTSTGPSLWSPTASWYVNFRDDIAPNVVKVWPYDGSEHIPYNAYIYLEFNESIALHDGTAIIPDPNLTAQTIKNFITISSDNGTTSRTLAASEYVVEFVGNNKKLLRITPFDVNGYNYNGAANPTMETYTDYTVTINPTAGIYTIVDAEENEMKLPGYSFVFKTEDITAPVWTAGPAFTGITCDNKVTFNYNITEASDTAVVYYAIVPAGANKPSASDLFAQTVAGALTQGKKGVDGGASTLTVDLSKLNADFDNDEAFKMYAVITDLEVDIWKPASAAWDTLFMFDPAKAYGEGHDRIRDIMPAPNKNNTVMPASGVAFNVWDVDAPQMVDSYPHAGDIQIPVGDSVRFWFNEAVMAGSADPNAIKLRRYDNNIAVDATVTWVAADSSFYIKPTNNLEQETKYYVEFDRYAIEDAYGVCSGNHVYYPQMVGRAFWFETEDNIGPRLYKVSPFENEACVSCPDLNADGTDILSIYFYDANEVVINSKASLPFVYLYRENESVVNAWDVISANLITIEKGANDTTWIAKVPLYHEYYPNDLIKVVVPKGLFVDKYENLAKVWNSVTNTATYEDKVWSYTTCNTEAPGVKWYVHSLSAHFNYSETPGGIEAEWTPNYKSGDYGTAYNNAPTHIALKVDFGEEVEFNTTGTTWKKLGTLTTKELMAMLKVSGLNYSETATASDFDQIIVDGNTVTLTFKYGTNAKLPSYRLLEDAYVIDGGGLAYLNGYYEASLKSLTEYKVTVPANKVRATNNCVKNSSPRYVQPDIVTINTRDDFAPTVSFENSNGESLCQNNDVCIDALEVINIVFDSPVVKSSYDVRWLGNESLTWDNLPLNDNDLKATDDSDYGKYIEFYAVTKGGTATAPTWTRSGSAIAVNVVATDDVNKVRYQIQPKAKLASEGWYQIKFNKHTVKKFVGNDPSGTVFEGDSCYFFVGDYEKPVWTLLDPSNTNTSVGSDSKELKVVFNEQIAKGEGVTKIRREDGTVYAEFNANSENIVWQNKNASNADTLVFKVNGLEEFTKYYVEMPAGFVVDDNKVCIANQFKGFAARLDANTKELLDADWWFQTTDATPPQLLSVNLEYEEMDPIALFPLVADTVSMYSNLEIIFDENVKITNSTSKGIVIYHDNGDEGSFGNAVEFIPWSNFGIPGSKLTLTGTDVYNGLTKNKLIIDPETVFNSKGTYYVRVNGDNVEDGTGNKWSDSEIESINPIRDREWYFTIVNDVAPVLVYTTPAYNGVGAAAGNYELLPATDYGYVETDLVMEFYDNTLANGGEPLTVGRGDNLRMFRVFEYTYDAAAAEFKSKPWIEIPITDPSIEFSGNKVTVKNVRLKDGIGNATGLTKGVVNDSCYYVTVDPGAVLNGYDESQTWWPGISNGFRWRFTTDRDEVFVFDGYQIISPNIEAMEDDARHLSIEAANTLVVKFSEGVQPFNGTGAVKVYDGATLVETVMVTADMCEGDLLSVPLADIYDMTTFTVVIEEGAIGDNATYSNPLPEAITWTFHTGDNTAPDPVTITPADGDECVKANDPIVLVYEEPNGVIANGGTLTIVDAEGTQVAQVVVTDDMIDFNTVTIQLEELLPDTTELTATLSLGFVVDSVGHVSPEKTWSFITGENTAPTAEIVSPVLVVTADTVIVIEFNEFVIPVTGKATLKVQGEEEGVEIAFVSEDSITFTAVVTDLASEVIYEVVFAEGAFEDINLGCDANGNPEMALTFEVADIAAPVAEFFPYEAPDYRDLELVIKFIDDEVKAVGGNVVVYDVETEEAVLTIPVLDFATTDNVSFTYTTSDLYYGEFYVLIDGGSFIDETAAPSGVEYAGVDTSSVWPLAIVDKDFADCYNIIAPRRNAVNVPVNTTISISFCDERIAPPVREGRFVTVADQSEERVEGVNVFTFFVADSMIEGNTLTIAVDGLKENTTYSIIVAEGAVTDEAGNEFAGINDANEWFFTTGDATAPTVYVDEVTVNNVDGSVAITSSETGMVFLAHENVAANATALAAAVANGTAASAPVYVGGVAVNVSTAGLTAGTYKAYAVDATGNVGVAENMVTIENVIEIPVYTIAQIQGTGAASPYVDQVVKTTGVVTGIDVAKNGFFMQDANAVRSGIYVYAPATAAQVVKGTGVTIVGKVTEYFDLTEITDVESVEFVAPVVTPEVITIQANQIGEDYEGVYVKVESLKTTAVRDNFNEWMTQTDAGVSVKIDDQLYNYDPSLGKRYHVSGVVNYTYSEYKLAPTEFNDVEKVTGIKALDVAIDVYPNPFDNYISVRNSSQVEITKAVITNIAGQLIKEVINPDNTISTTELRSGVYFISLHTEDGIAKTARIIKR